MTNWQIPPGFNDWWDGEVEHPENPFEKDTPAYWAWEGWMAGSAAEREACAQIVEAVDSHANPMTANDCAAAIRARGQV